MSLLESKLKEKGIKSPTEEDEQKKIDDDRDDQTDTDANDDNSDSEHHHHPLPGEAHAGEKVTADPLLVMRQELEEKENRIKELAEALDAAVQENYGLEDRVRIYCMSGFCWFHFYC